MSKKKMPDITLTAVGTKAKIPLSRLNRPAVLCFLWEETEPLGDQVREAVRAKYPQPAQVLIINLADLRGLPRMMRGLAEKGMEKGYKRLAASVPSGESVSHHVIILPDWKGEVADAVAAGDTHKTPAVAVLNDAAEIVGVHQGMDLADAALELLEQTEIAEE